MDLGRILTFEKMTCPHCGNAFPRFSSFKLSPFKPLECGHCGAGVKRKGKLVPLVLAVVGILGFGYLQSVVALTTVGNLLLLLAIVGIVLVIDESTVELEVVAKPADRPAGRR